MDTYTHKPLQADVIQFDGTIDRLVEIIGAVVDPDAQTEVITHMVGGGVIDNARVNGGGIYLDFRNGDHVMKPRDDRAPYVLSDVDFQRAWANDAAVGDGA